MKKKIKIRLPDDVKFLIKTLKAKKHDAYVVGGCVRDSLMHKKPHDWDLCTSATPAQMLKIFKNEKIIETGLQHGTITVIINDTPYEITTYRIDGQYSDHRKPDSVEFTNNLVEDLKRRDFTINAMAYNNKEGLIDPFNGMQDLERKFVRCVGSAEERFNEDALRILRAIRFASQLKFGIASETEYGIYKTYNQLANISMERINSEFCKILSAKKCGTELLLYKEVFECFIPEIRSLYNFSQNNPWHIWNVFEHTVSALYHAQLQDLITKLAVFFHDFGKPHSYQDDENGIRHFRGHAKVSAEITDMVMKRLKFDNDTRNKVVQLVLYHDATILCDKKNIKRWLNKIGEQQLRRLINVKIADNQAQNLSLSKPRLQELKTILHMIDSVVQEKECFTLKNLAINGDDLIKIGYVPGKTLGLALTNLLNCVITEEIKNNKEDLIDLAHSWLSNQVVNFN